VPLDKKGTYCPFLWDSVFIDPQGNVYACCHKKPSVIGNINRETLRTIYNNATIQELRRKSLAGELECYDKCSLIDKEGGQGAPKRAAFDYSADLRKLKIEFGELCNISCIMCWQDHKSKTVLDHKKLMENVDLGPFRSIEIQGGEPLAIPNARAFYEYLASRNKEPFFLTNGLLISDEWAEKIALNSSFIYISLNAATKKTHELVNRGSKWDVVLKNIQKLREARQAHKTGLKISGHMTIVMNNVREIPLFISDFRKFGLDMIDFGYDKNMPEHLRRYPFSKILLKREIYRAVRASKDHSSMDLMALRLLKLV